MIEQASTSPCDPPSVRRSLWFVVLIGAVGVGVMLALHALIDPPLRPSDAFDAGIVFAAPLVIRFLFGRRKVASMAPIPGEHWKPAHVALAWRATWPVVLTVPVSLLPGRESAPTPLGPYLVGMGVFVVLFVARGLGWVLVFGPRELFFADDRLGVCGRGREWSARYEDIKFVAWETGSRVPELNAVAGLGHFILQMKNGELRKMPSVLTAAPSDRRSALEFVAAQTSARGIPVGGPVLAGRSSAPEASSASG